MVKANDIDEYRRIKKATLDCIASFQLDCKIQFIWKFQWFPRMFCGRIRWLTWYIDVVTQTKQDQPWVLFCCIYFDRWVGRNIREEF